MVHGSNVKSCKEALRLTRIYPGVIYSSCGIHPMDSKNVIEEPSSWIEFEEIAQQPEVVAIGPCGLDYHRDAADSETQKEMFRRQIKLACDLQKPILVHERSAQEDVMEILLRYVKEQLVLIENVRKFFFSFPNSPPKIIRSFMGTIEEATVYLESGFYLALTGFLCKVCFCPLLPIKISQFSHFQDKSENSVRKLLESNLIPLDRLLVESDSPFMYPNTRASKLSATVKSGLTERSLMFLHR